MRRTAGNCRLYRDLSFQTKSATPTSWQLYNYLSVVELAINAWSHVMVSSSGAQRVVCNTPGFGLY